MIRLISIFIGLGFTIVVLFSLISGLGPAGQVLSEHGQFVEPTAEHEFHKHPHGPKDGFKHDGLVGKWNIAQLQRGYQVYKEVCASCHGLKFVATRDLAQLGYSEAEIKAEAASRVVPGIDPNTGEASTRPGVPTDYYLSPYANNVMAAAANNNAIPPDLSLMTKARHNGTEYVYSLLTGYSGVPTKLKEEFPDFSTPPGLHFNRYFPNLNLAMAPPLTADGQVSYADGTPATIDQMAQDVAAFLTWTAEPTMVARRQRGWAILGFLIFATILGWFAKQQVWAAVKPKKKA